MKKKKQKKKQSKTKMKKNKFLFRNTIIGIFLSCESLILADSKHVYSSGKVFNIFWYIGVNITFGG